MSLSRIERYLVVNQLKILESLYPEEADEYAKQRVAFEEGYERHYEWAMAHISNEVLNDEIIKEVIDTLDMYSAIWGSYQNLTVRDGINIQNVRFPGYDGNHSIEGRMMGYARYFVVDLNRFSGILAAHDNAYFDFNSHCERRQWYKEMLNRWKQVPEGIEFSQRHQMSLEQIKNVIG